MLSARAAAAGLTAAGWGAAEEVAAAVVARPSWVAPQLAGWEVAQAAGWEAALVEGCRTGEG